MGLASTVVALGALVGSAIMAGVFFAFSSFVMRALAELEPEHGIRAMQRINVRVLNPLFLGVFMGTGVASLGAIVLGALAWSQPGAPYMVAGGTLYAIGTFGVTLCANVPLNDALAGVTPDADDAREVWEHYLRSWTRWNHVRTLAPTLGVLAFGIAMRLGV